ncbi:MAG TPA: electron transfer flavoprotein subunit beta/FixA family protein [Synergistaceae bacterium]|nr:electron transfer flavoprotein subunit beta/FixA family protein [Synergistaceae bacterium]HPJ25309.1 electron transfer flavoprotein subunit beta/FixA family protein [Synergistaceae bacterium]HPQ36359.1 electron transfer flavoprotein subunit beta/FixA family protein [Synergistaceae bacterium]
MNIAVLIKQVPDTEEVRMDPERGTMIRQGVGSIINPLDLNALEGALAFRRIRGGKVTVFSMGPLQAEEALREALALGADEGYLLTDSAFAGGDTWATAKVLAEACRKTGPYDLILGGEKATDGETGQVCPEVAVMLDIPFSTYVSFMELREEGVRIRRTVEEGGEWQFLPFPCLLTVLRNLNEPSLPTLAGKKRARRTSLPRYGREELELSEKETGLSGSPTRVVHIDYPSLTRETAFFGPGDTEKGLDLLMQKLRELALL